MGPQATSVWGLKVRSNYASVLPGLDAEKARCEQLCVCGCVRACVRACVGVEREREIAYIYNISILGSRSSLSNLKASYTSSLRPHTLVA